jgi:hypothetical protein
LWSDAGTTGRTALDLVEYCCTQRLIVLYYLLSPMNEGEKSAGEVPVVSVAPAAGEITVGSTVKRTKTYTFDKACAVPLIFTARLVSLYTCGRQVFGQYSTQEEVFNVSIVPIIEEVLQGFNCTVFAYGQTGTGKTHTMEGEMGATANAGIIPRSLHMLFEKLTRTATEFSVRLSFMELYNEVSCVFVRCESSCRSSAQTMNVVLAATGGLDVQRRERAENGGTTASWRQT